jgi:hypothetical protein
MQNCIYCNKVFKSHAELFTHNEKNHPEENDKVQANTCSKCRKELSCRQAKWRHEKTCEGSEVVKLKQENLEMKKQMEELFKKFQELEAKVSQNITNNTMTNSNNTIYDNRVTTVNNYNLYSLDNITAELYSGAEKKYVVNGGRQCTKKFVKISFNNPEKPELNSIRPSNKDGCFDIFIEKTNKFEAKDKNEIYDLIRTITHKCIREFIHDKEVIEDVDSDKREEAKEAIKCLKERKLNNVEPEVKEEIDRNRNKFNAHVEKVINGNQ